MKREFDFKDAPGERIKDALAQECRGMQPSSNLKERIDEEIRNYQEEMGKMKHFGIKKAVVVTAAACLLVSGGAYAAGHATGLISSSYPGGQYHSYSGDMDKAEGKLGYGVKTVESFDNGYSFQNMQVIDVQGMDDNKQQVYTYKSMSIDYEKQGCPKMYVDMCRPVEKEARTKTPDATRVCGDITLYYDEYTYKFVPTDYEMTAEDKANEQKDNYFISVGSDAVEIQKSAGVTWEQDGVCYNMAGFDLGLSAEEMLDMAEQIVEEGE